MNFKYSVLVLLGLLFIYSCNEKNEIDSISISSEDAQIYSITLTGSHKKTGDSLSRAQDSLRFLTFAKTKFAIDQVGGLIYNPDSLPYGFKLEKAKMTLTYNPTYGVRKVEIQHPDSATWTEWNGRDSISLSRGWTNIKVHAQASEIKNYRLELRVHKVDPEVIVWKDMDSFPASIDDQKVLLIDNQFYSFVFYSGSVKLYKSQVNNLSWVSSDVSGLPASLIVSSIHYLNGNFFAIANDGSSYTSTDGGLTWSVVVNYKYVKTIYGVVPASIENDDELLVLLKDGENYSFATTKNIKDFTPINGVGIPSLNTLPVSGFAAYTNYDRKSNSNLLLITGGLNIEAENATTEDVKDKGRLSSVVLAQRGVSGVSLSVSAKTSLFKGEGLSAFMYNQGSIYVFANDSIYISPTASWGYRWVIPKNMTLDSGMGKRTDRQVIVDGENIWVFGGRSRESNTYYNDVWRGRLNGVK